MLNLILSLFTFLGIGTISKHDSFVYNLIFTPSVTVSLATEYYYASSNHTEWRVGVTFSGSMSDDLIDCIKWQSKISGNWQNIINANGKKITPDGLLGQRYEIRIFVRYDDGINVYEVYSDPLLIGVNSIENGQEWPGLNTSPYFDICGQ